MTEQNDIFTDEGWDEVQESFPYSSPTATLEGAYLSATGRFFMLLSLSLSREYSRHHLNRFLFRRRGISNNKFFRYV